MEKHYWKNAYKEFWEIAASKEDRIKKIIESETGLSVIVVGLGAGSTEFIEGDAKDNNLKKGDADLYVVDKDCYIEVTGPNIPMNFEKPLWVRPDKLKNAFNKLENGEGKLHVVVHVVEPRNEDTIIRVVILDKLFYKHLYDDKQFPLVYPRIRGKSETYYELPPVHETIVSLEEFLAILKDL